MEDRIRAALRAVETRQGLSLRGHARLMGVSAVSLGEFLRGETGLGATMAKAIRAAHPELLHLLIAWLADEEAGTVAAPGGR